MENAFAPMVDNVNQHSAMLATNLSKSVVTESTSVKSVTQTVISDHFVCFFIFFHLSADL